MAAKTGRASWNDHEPRIRALEALVCQLLDASPIELFKINSFSNNIGSIEIGSTVTDIVFNWSLSIDGSSDPGVQSISPSVGVIPITDRTVPLSGLNITTNISFLLSASSGGANDTRNTQISFLNSRYWGVSPNADIGLLDLIDIGSAGIEEVANPGVSVASLSKQLSSSRTSNRNYDATGGNYIYIMYPFSIGAATFKSLGFPFSGMIERSILFTNESGNTSTFYVYRSLYIQTGANVNIEVL